MQIPIVSGIYTDAQANYRVAYPRNLVPVPKQNGVSEGYLRIAEGITQLVAAGAVQGSDRGGYQWNGICYRVIGSKLVTIDAGGVLTVLGDVGNDSKQVSFDRSFDFLIIGSAGKLYYWAPMPLITAISGNVQAAGAGYVVGDTVTLTNDIGLTISSVGTAGAVTGFTILHGGLSATNGSGITLGQAATTGVGVGLTVVLNYAPVPDRLYQVTSSGLGTVVDALWFAGYTVTTDGANIIVTDLNDPSYVDPLKYGSSEYSPDPLVGLARFREELYVFNRYTTEVFDNVGGLNFPFQVNQGAVIEKGAMSRSTKCLMAQRLWFVGSGLNESISVYYVVSGIAVKVATQEIEETLAQYTEEQLALCILESREDRVHQHLYLHLPDQTLVYDYAASQVMEQPIWFALSSDASAYGMYRGRNFVRCYNRWICGDAIDSRIGYLDRSSATQYGAIVGHQFDVALLYNGAHGATVQQLELIGQTGLVSDPTLAPRISMKYTRDGKVYGRERFRSLGRQGAFQQRLLWINALFFRQVAGLRFHAATPALASYTRLEAQIKALAV